MNETHDETCDLDDDCSCEAVEDSTGADDEFQDGMTWADDVPLMCGVENPEVCESCT